MGNLYNTARALKLVENVVTTIRQLPPTGILWDGMASGAFNDDSQPDQPEPRKEPNPSEREFMRRTKEEEIPRLRQEIAQLESELYQKQATLGSRKRQLNALVGYIDLMEGRDDSMRLPGCSLSSPRLYERFPGSASARIRGHAYQLLVKVGGTLSLTELVALMKSECAFQVPSKHPNNLVSAALFKDSRFMNVRRGNWCLSEDLATPKPAVS